MKMIEGFLKEAAIKLPASFHKAHLMLNTRLSTPGYSKKRVSEMLRRRVKK
jgi:hypothetical protein